jgi:O-antigen/teichoic acid export membrane protein
MQTHISFAGPEALRGSSLELARNTPATEALRLAKMEISMNMRPKIGSDSVASAPEAAALPNRIVNIASHLLRRSAIGSIGLKGASAFLNLAVFALASRAMSRDSFGELAIWYNLLSFSAVIAGFGQDSVFTQFWNKHISGGEYAQAKGILFFCTSMTAVFAIVGTIAMTLYFWLAKEEADLTLVSIALFMGVQTIVLVTTSMCRSICGYISADVPNEFFWRFCVLAMVAYCLVAGVAMRPATFLLMAALGSTLAIFTQILVMRRHFPYKVRKVSRVLNLSSLLRDSIAYLGAATTGTTSQYVEVIVIGSLLSPAEAGAYFVASRFGNVFAMISTGVAGYALNSIAKHYFDGRFDRLQALHRETMKIVAIAGLVMFAIVIFGGRPLLGLFGDSYRAEYWTLVFLSMGALTIALAGQAGMALLVTGHQRRFTLYQAFNIVLRMTLIVVFGHIWGSSGAALGAMISTFPFAVALVATNRRLLRTDPSIFCLLPTLRDRRWKGLSSPDLTKS